MINMRLKLVVFASLAVVALAIQAFSGVACAADKRGYLWSSYQKDFYSDDYEATLLRIIKQSDAAGRKIAPGLLAEYGYFFFERGQFDTAIYWFEREIGEWPDSAALMKKMIERAREGAPS